MIGNCPSTTDSPESRRRRAWIIKRAMTGQNVNGDLNRLEPKDRPLVRLLLKAEGRTRRRTSSPGIWSDFLRKRKSCLPPQYPRLIYPPLIQTSARRAKIY